MSSWRSYDLGLCKNCRKEEKVATCDNHMLFEINYFPGEARTFLQKRLFLACHDVPMQHDVYLLRHAHVAPVC